MGLKKNDFIEIKFTGKTKDRNIFDTNIKEDIKKSNLEKASDKPFIFCIGQNMFLKSVDDFLIGKPEKPDTYQISLDAENAFGKRQQNLVQKMPMNVFRQHQINPVPGVMFNFDGRIGKVLTASGGRVIVDFNNPLAGKDVEYKIKVNRKVTDINEKINALTDFFLRKNLKFQIKDKKIIFEADEQTKPLLEMFKDKFKEMLDYDIEIKSEKQKSDKKSQ